MVCSLRISPSRRQCTIPSYSWYTFYSLHRTIRNLKRGVGSAALKLERTNTNTATSEVLLYENTTAKPKYFKLIAIVSGIQLFFWTYLSYAALTDFSGSGSTKREHGIKVGNTEAQSQSKPAWFTSSKWRLVGSLVSLGAGIFFAVIANMYPQRIVHRLYFLQRLSAAQIQTYSPFGSVRSIQVPLGDITCTGDRLTAKAQLALKVRGYPLYFLMDKQGRFVAPRMFDTLIASRKKVI